MRNLIRQPLTWMVIAECVVVALLIVVVWNVVAAAATQHPAATPAQAINSVTAHQIRRCPRCPWGRSRHGRASFRASTWTPRSCGGGAAPLTPTHGVYS